MAYRVLLKTACIDDLEIHAYREAKTRKLRITGVTINGRLAVPTLSFWRSMFGEVGLATCVGARFDEYAWFSRLRCANPFLVFRYAIAIDHHGNAMLLGIPRKGFSSWNVTDTGSPSENDLETDGDPDGDPEDHMAERLSHHWQQAATDAAAKGFMDAPAGSLRPSLN